jgi:hypothetical protein
MKTSVQRNPPSAALPDPSEPLFKPFQWVGEQRQRGPYDMLSDVRDLAAGVSLTLAMVERSQLSRESGGAPLLDNGDELRLMRMSIAAMHMVEGRIDTYFEHLSNPSMPAVEAEKGRTA